jgi:hypothetical protein
MVNYFEDYIIFLVKLGGIVVLFSVSCDSNIRSPGQFVSYGSYSVLFILISISEYL